MKVYRKTHEIVELKALMTRKKELILRSALNRASNDCVFPAEEHDALNRIYGAIPKGGKDEKDTFRWSGLDAAGNIGVGGPDTGPDTAAWTAEVDRRGTAKRELDAAYAKGYQLGVKVGGTACAKSRPDTPPAPEPVSTATNYDREYWAELNRLALDARDRAELDRIAAQLARPVGDNPPRPPVEDKRERPTHKQVFPDVHTHHTYKPLRFDHPCGQPAHWLDKVRGEGCEAGKPGMAAGSHPPCGSGPWLDHFQSGYVPESDGND